MCVCIEPQINKKTTRWQCNCNCNLTVSKTFTDGSSISLFTRLHLWNRNCLGNTGSQWWLQHFATSGGLFFLVCRFFFLCCFVHVFYCPKLIPWFLSVCASVTETKTEVFLGYHFLGTNDNILHQFSFHFLSSFVYVLKQPCLSNKIILHTRFLAKQIMNNGCVYIKIWGGPWCV